MLGSTSVGRVICDTDLAECVSIPGDKKNGDARGVMVTVLGYGHGDTNLNPG